ncbi:MAG TPA: hypothetical protein VJ842_05640 [Pyrinomonadaceae bacterium]|nr:hypothetical protein [Pyrinomonadaceae bacterium]
MPDNPKKDKSQKQSDAANAAAGGANQPPSAATPTGDAEASSASGARGGSGQPPDVEESQLADGRRAHVLVGGLPGAPNVPVELQGASRVFIEGAVPTDVTNDPAAALNAIVMARTSAMRFTEYEKFITEVFCPRDDDEVRSGESRLRLGGGSELSNQFEGARVGVNSFSNLYSYELLKVATEAFLALQCTDIIRVVKDDRRGRDRHREPVFEITDPPGLPDYQETYLARSGNTEEEIRRALVAYLGPNRTLPYIDAIAGPLVRVAKATTSPLGDVSPFARFNPCWIELLWSYWHEEGMLVQTINAISLRFQNKRSRLNGEHDPLAHLELELLRPLNNILWGYIQDEMNRLTVARRAYEYQYEYGLTLYGKAVPALNPADVRSKFIEAFHNLLHAASLFYRDQSNKFVVPDSFPLLNALKEVHLLLAEGAHNQFGDLPWTARAEMLIQKFILSRPEMQRFFGGRFMVPYPETWMGVVDQMKTLQGWTDVSVRYFRDLAVYGERLLLSIRWGNWSNVDSSLTAENWANSWRDAVYGYIHAYRAVTGVDLSVSTNAVRLAAESYMQPSLLLRNRLQQQQRR